MNENKTLSLGMNVNERAGARHSRKIIYKDRRHFENTTHTDKVFRAGYRITAHTNEHHRKSLRQTHQNRQPSSNHSVSSKMYTHINLRHLKAINEWKQNILNSEKWLAYDWLVFIISYSALKCYLNIEMQSMKRKKWPPKKK